MNNGGLAQEEIHMVLFIVVISVFIALMILLFVSLDTIKWTRWEMVESVLIGSERVIAINQNSKLTLENKAHGRQVITFWLRDERVEEFTVYDDVCEFNKVWKKDVVKAIKKEHKEAIVKRKREGREMNKRYEELYRS